MTMNMRFSLLQQRQRYWLRVHKNGYQNNPAEARITAGGSGRRPVLWTTGGTPTESAMGWDALHDHDHGRQVQERGIRNHEYRHQRGLHPDDGGRRHLLRGCFSSSLLCRLRALRIGRKRLHPAWYRRKITVNTSNQPTTRNRRRWTYIHATGAKADKDSPTVSFTGQHRRGRQRPFLQAQDGLSYPQGAGVEHRRFLTTLPLEFDRLTGRPGSRGNVR